MKFILRENTRVCIHTERKTGLMEKIKAGIIGATGYAGAELARILLQHPSVTLTAVSSVSYEGKTLAEVYPNFQEICEIPLEKAETLIPRCDVVFASLPHGLSETYAEQCLAAGAVFIDLGADFRLHDAEAYSAWYNKEYTKPQLHEKAVYALPELYRSEIQKADLIGNPGCYPTSIALGLAPALRRGLIQTSSVVIDSKSGVTGAGAALTQNTHFPNTNEAFSAYKAGLHRHTPEIEQTLSELCGTAVTVVFVPHLLPLNRGIESTIYVKMAPGADMKKIRAAYEEDYTQETFVRVRPEGTYANLRDVKYSNYCDISLHSDIRTNTLIISSCIDNMVKGAAGQAVQNMNIRFGLDEDTGLRLLPPAF